MSIFILCSRFGGTTLQPVARSTAGTPGEVGRGECRGRRGRSCGEDGSEGLGWRRPDLECPPGAVGAVLGRRITGRRSAGRELGPDLAQPWRLPDQQRGRGLGRRSGELPSGLWDPRSARRAGASPAVRPEWSAVTRGRRRRGREVWSNDKHIWPRVKKSSPGIPAFEEFRLRSKGPWFALCSPPPSASARPLPR